VQQKHGKVKTKTGSIAFQSSRLGLLFSLYFRKEGKKKRATESGRFDNDIREHEEVVLRGKRKLLCSLLLILSLDEEPFPLCELFFEPSSCT